MSTSSLTARNDPVRQTLSTAMTWFVYFRTLGKLKILFFSQCMDACIRRFYFADYDETCQVPGYWNTSDLKICPDYTKDLDAYRKFASTLALAPTKLATEGAVIYVSGGQTEKAGKICPQCIKPCTQYNHRYLKK